MPNELKDPTNAATDRSVKRQTGQALIVQTHAMTIERQPLVAFGDILKTQPRLVSVQDGLNKALTESKTQAQLYLGTLQPAMINTITRVDRYFNLQLALTSIIKSQDKDKIIRSLQAAEDQTLAFKAEADDVAGRLDTLRKSLQANGAEFLRQKQTLIEITDADDGIMKELDRTISDIDGKMGGLIAAAVISGLAIVGGALLIAVGAIAGFVTAGTSTPLAVLGGTILVAGVGGAVASGIGLGTLAKQKGDLLMQKTGLSEEVKFARALQSSITTLTDSTSSAAKAAQDMSNAWTLLGGHMRNLADDLSAGRMEIDGLLELFVTAADGDVKDIKADVRAIQQQLLGLKPIVADSGSLTDAIDVAMKTANQNAAIAA